MNKIKYIVIVVIITLFLTGCETKKVINKEPEISQIRAICNLATLKTYYHNVAKAVKDKDQLFQQKREMWIEYTGIATIGIDMSKVEMTIDGDIVSVTLPKAKLLNIDIDEDKISKDNYYYSEDNDYLFKNEFTSEDETKAINEAQKNMKKSVEENNQLLQMAQERAKSLIQKYIEQMGELSGHNYEIKWIQGEEKK